MPVHAEDLPETVAKNRRRKIGRLVDDFAMISSADRTNKQREGVRRERNTKQEASHMLVSAGAEPVLASIDGMGKLAIARLDPAEIKTRSAI